MNRGVYKYIVPRDLSDAEVAKALSALPAWRLQKALSYRRPIDRFLCAKAYNLLKQALEECFAFTSDITFSYGPGGKPFLEGRPGIHFNLSHCSSCVCCIVSSRPVGIDVEDIQYDSDLMEIAFNPQEREVIRKADSPEVEFTRLWTMKECCLKLRGDGITDDIRDVLTQKKPRLDIEINADRGYVMCAAEEIF